MAEQSTAVQYRGGTTTEHSSFIGLEREVTVDVTKKTLVVHDGLTAGGYPLAKSSELNNGLNAVNTSLNNKADVTYVDTNITAVNGKINTEKARIDAILSASTADKDSFKEIVDLINSVDTTNDTTFAGYVSSNNTRVSSIEAGALYKSGGVLTGPIIGVRECAINLGTNTSLPINLNEANYFSMSFNSNTTLSVSNVMNISSSNANASTVNSFMLELTNAGAYTITWWPGIKWQNGVAPTLTASGVDILGFITRDNGTTWRGMVLSKDSK